MIYVSGGESIFLCFVYSCYTYIPTDVCQRKCAQYVVQLKFWVCACLSFLSVCISFLSVCGHTYVCVCAHMSVCVYRYTWEWWWVLFFYILCMLTLCMTTLHFSAGCVREWWGLFRCVVHMCFWVCVQACSGKMMTWWSLWKWATPCSVGCIRHVEQVCGQEVIVRCL